MMITIRDEHGESVFNILTNPDEAIEAAIEFLEELFDGLELTGSLSIPTQSRYTIEISH
jgi:hypothetical protein